MLGCGLLGCGKKEEPPKTEAPTPLAIPTVASSTATASASEKAEPSWRTDLTVGTGAEATDGKKVTVHYTLWLEKNYPQPDKKLESSHDKNKPKSFQLGSGQMIKGWDLGIPGMKVGGKRKLVLPPQLGYGGAGSPPSIPGNATLVFEIELLDVK